ncbi:MAG: hypothetical protein QOC78_1584, partial [Solirubrobacteraceae bacterium]|nr:hypothetical protein [Solirubrobacteraceae bacterium]
MLAVADHALHDWAARTLAAAGNADVQAAAGSIGPIDEPADAGYAAERIGEYRQMLRDHLGPEPGRKIKTSDV